MERLRLAVGRDRPAPWERLDLVLLAATVALSVLGALMVAAASGRGKGHLTPIVAHQLVFDLIGALVAVVAALVDYRRVERFGGLVYGGAVFLLAVVLSPLGSTVNGARSWFSVGSFELQPAEFVKIGLIIVLAAVGVRAGDRLDARRLSHCLVLVGVPAGLILLQPDLGEVLVLSAITLTVIAVAGASGRHLAALGILVVIAATLALQLGFIKSYQQDRLTYFLSPTTGRSSGAAYNARQAEIAIGSGGIVGTGLFRGSQTRNQFVPEQQTDFIFSVVGEQLGLLGTATLLGLDAIIVWRVWRAATLARDQLGTLLCSGVLGMFLFHVFENVGMNTGIMPITGIPLPLVSYGGSATVTTFAALGLVLSVHRHRFS